LEADLRPQRDMSHAAGVASLSSRPRMPGVCQGVTSSSYAGGSSPSSSSKPPQASAAAAELPVFLNIYDVSKRDEVKMLNTVLAHWLAPVKFGGAFHVGVEVGGVEWSYGRTFRDTRPGIVGYPPRSDPQHSFRQAVHLGETQLSMEMVNNTISEIIEEYPGNSYDVLRHNCCHFAEDFCQRLSVSPPPAWVHRLARFGAGADSLIQMVCGTGNCIPRDALPASLASVSESHGSGCHPDEGGELVPASPAAAGGEPPELVHAPRMKDFGNMAPL